MYIALPSPPLPSHECLPYCPLWMLCCPALCEFSIALPLVSALLPCPLWMLYCLAPCEYSMPCPLWVLYILPSVSALVSPLSALLSSLSALLPPWLIWHNLMTKYGWWIMIKGVFKEYWAASLSWLYCDNNSITLYLHMMWASLGIRLPDMNQ